MNYLNFIKLPWINLIYREQSWNSLNICEFHWTNLLFLWLLFNTINYIPWITLDSFELSWITRITLNDLILPRSFPILPRFLALLNVLQGPSILMIYLKLSWIALNYLGWYSLEFDGTVWLVMAVDGMGWLGMALDIMALNFVEW